MYYWTPNPYMVPTRLSVDVLSYTKDLHSGAWDDPPFTYNAKSRRMEPDSEDQEEAHRLYLHWLEARAAVYWDHSVGATIRAGASNGRLHRDRAVIRDVIGMQWCSWAQEWDGWNYGNTKNEHEILGRPRTLLEKAGEEIAVKRSAPEDPEDASWEWHGKRKQQEDEDGGEVRWPSGNTIALPASVSKQLTAYDRSTSLRQRCDAHHTYQSSRSTSNNEATQHSIRPTTLTMSYGRNVTYPVRGTWAQGYDGDHGEAYEWDADEEYLLPTGFDQHSDRYGAFGGWDSRNPEPTDPGTGSRWRRTRGAPYGIDREHDRVRAMVDGRDLDRWAQIPDYTRRGPSHTRWGRARQANDDDLLPYDDPYEAAAAVPSRRGRWQLPEPSFGIIDNNRSGLEYETRVRRPPHRTLGENYYLDRDDYRGEYGAKRRPAGLHSNGWSTYEDEHMRDNDPSELDFYDPEF
ncbi:hypothetical protein LTR81_020588 [Elasticomyces elasticus]